MSRLTPKAGIALEWTFLSIALIFVLLRIYVRIFLQKIFRAGDVVIVLAWWLFLVGNICDTLSFSDGLWFSGIIFTADTSPNLERYFPDKKQLEDILKVLYASSIPYYASLWCVKLAFILLYFQIVPKSLKRIRFALCFTAAFVAVGFVCMLCFNLFWCLPVKRNWSTDIRENCFTYASEAAYFVTLGFHLLSDLMIYGLPFFLFPVLKKISGNTRKDLYGLAAVFSLGGSCIACTIARIAVNGVNAWLPLISAWSAAEMCVAVVVACCPPLKLLWLGYTTYGIRRGSLANVGNTVEYGRREDIEDYATGGRVVRAGENTEKTAGGHGRIQAEEVNHTTARLGLQGNTDGAHSTADSQTTGVLTAPDDSLIESGGLSVATVPARR